MNRFWVGNEVDGDNWRKGDGSGGTYAGKVVLGMTRRRDKGNKFRHPNLKALVNNREHRQRNRVGGR